jgi:tetratricopeptide (TPR) repeat protein
MSIDSVDLDSLTDWLDSVEGSQVQRHFEERIYNILFSQDPSHPAFQQMAIQLAWLGSSPAQRSLLQKEIIALNAAFIEKCDFLKIGKAYRKSKEFFSNHANEIATAVTLVAAAAGIAAVTGYALSVSVGGIVVAGAGAVYEAWKADPCPAIPNVPNPASKHELAIFGQPLPSSLPKIDLPSSLQQLLITPEGIWANGQFFPTDAIRKGSSFSSILTQPDIDWKGFAYYSYLSGQPENFQARGETALVLGQYSQALQDLAKVIETSPSDPLPYLERGIAHFGLKQYDESLEDYRHYHAETQKTHPPSISDFSLGFAKGLPKGIYESEIGMLFFLADFIKHPIHTSMQVFDSITTLITLLRASEWNTLAEALSPEMHQLVTQWDTLSSDQRGELAGYALGKCGADILTPGALAKIASKSAKSAQELAAICKNLQLAQETLVLETATGIGNGVKIAEVIREGQTMMALGEELGFTAREMGDLKQAGKLEGALKSGLEKLVSQSESEVYRIAVSQNKHVKMVRDYLDKPTKEIQKGISSYEKQIAVHKDKIANPTKYIPEWDKLDPRQREALLNKKWPAEIQGYEEQRNLLQSILSERLSNE